MLLTCLYLTLFLLRYAFSNISLGTARLLLVFFIPIDFPKGANQYLYKKIKHYESKQLCRLVFFQNSINFLMYINIFFVYNIFRKLHIYMIYIHNFSEVIHQYI